MSWALAESCRVWPLFFSLLLDIWVGEGRASDAHWDFLTQGEAAVVGLYLLTPRMHSYKNSFASL